MVKLGRELLRLEQLGMLVGESGVLVGRRPPEEASRHLHRRYGRRGRRRLGGRMPRKGG